LVARIAVSGFFTVLFLAVSVLVFGGNRVRRRDHGGMMGRRRLLLVAAVGLALPCCSGGPRARVASPASPIVPLQLRGGRRHTLAQATAGAAAGGMKVPVGAARPAGEYAALWSREHKAEAVVVSADGRSAFNPHFTETLDEDVIFEGWSVRADRPLPKSGRHYFEVSISQEDKPDGLPHDTLEEGWNTIGLVSHSETNFKGWWWKDKRRRHTWGIHDSMRHAYVCVSSPSQEASRWARGASFGDHDRVGLLVDMDTRVCHMFLNCKYMGIVFTDLPPCVYPLVTLVAAKTTALLHTSLRAPTINGSHPLPQVFGYAGAPGMKYGQCSKPGHSARGCSGLCDPVAYLTDDEFQRCFGEPKPSEAARLLNEVEHVEKRIHESGAASFLDALAGLNEMRRQKLQAAKVEMMREGGGGGGAMRGEGGGGVEQLLEGKTRGRWSLSVEPPRSGGKNLAGKLLRSMVHTAASGTRLEVARGEYKFQRHVPWERIAAFARLHLLPPPNMHPPPPAHARTQRVACNIACRALSVSLSASLAVSVSLSVVCLCSV